MRKINFVIFIILDFLLTANCFAYTIIAKERGTVLYGLKNGKLILEKDKANYKIYYEIDEESGIIKRTKREDDFARWPTVAKVLLLRRWEGRHEGFDVISNSSALGSRRRAVIASDRRERSNL